MKRNSVRPQLLRALVLVVAVACASGPPPPEWLQGGSTTYPDDRFVVGIASADSADSAAELSLRSISLQTNGETEGARIEQTWVDPETDTHWALAVLERAPLVSRLLAELAEVDAQITRALAAADTDAPDESLSALAAALARVPERDRLRERIAQLGDPAPAADADARKRADDLRSKLAEIKKRLRIEISAHEMDSKTGETGDPLAENRRALTQKVIALGFAIGQSEVAWGDDPIWLRVESKVARERLRLLPSDTLVAVHWDASVEITDVDAGEVVAVLTEQGRATHISEPEARRQADAAATEFAARSLEEWLNGRIHRTGR